MASKYKYEEIAQSDVPAEITRWDVPAQNGGQIVEVAYGARVGDADEACAGARYKRETDRSDQSVAYYRRVPSQHDVDAKLSGMAGE